MSIGLGFSGGTSIPPAQAEFKYYIGCFGDSITNGAVYTDGTSPDGKTPPAWHVSDANNNYLRAWGWLYFKTAGACTVDFSNWEIRRLLAGSVYS